MENRLYRSRTDRVLGGVCGGLGEHLKIEPVILRIIFVVLFLAGGSGFLVYLVFWIVVPEQLPENSDQSQTNQENTMSEEKDYQPKHPEDRKGISQNGSLIAGVILITLGALFLIDRFIPRIDFGDLWPVLLVVIGIGLVYRGATESTSKDKTA